MSKIFKLGSIKLFMNNHWKTFGGVLLWLVSITLTFVLLSYSSQHLAGCGFEALEGFACSNFFILVVVLIIFIGAILGLLGLILFLIWLISKKNKEKIEVWWKKYFVFMEIYLILNILLLIFFRFS